MVLDLSIICILAEIDRACPLLASEKERIEQDWNFSVLSASIPTLRQYY